MTDLRSEKTPFYLPNVGPMAGWSILQWVRSSEEILIWIQWAAQQKPSSLDLFEGALWQLLKLNPIFILHFVQISHLPPHAFSSNAPCYKSYGFTASHTLGLSHRQGPGPGSQTWLRTETKKELVLILHSWISAGTKKIVAFSWELWHLQCVLPLR